MLGHRTLGEGAAGVASVVHDDQEDGARVSGIPAIPHKTWLRAATAQASLPDLLKELRALRQRVQVLESALAEHEHMGKNGSQASARPRAASDPESP